MLTFHNGEFVNGSPQNICACIYFYGNSNALYINFYGRVERFILDSEENSIVYDQGINSVEVSSYCMLLGEYLNDNQADKKGRNQICGFDKDALNQLTNMWKCVEPHLVNLKVVTT